MFFGKKNNSGCPQCKSKIDDSFSFCPYCGESLTNPEQEMKDFGMLGRNDVTPKRQANNKFSQGDFGMFDQMINSMINNLAKSINQQLNNSESNAEIENFPNGIKIKIGGPMTQHNKLKKQVPAKKVITEEQLKKMAGLPRVEAKTNIRRFSDKVVYVMSTPGIESVKDVFISKLESGYEIKAIGNKKVYVNSLPINLPLHGYGIENDNLFVEFKTQEQ